MGLRCLTYHLDNTKLHPKVFLRFELATPVWPQPMHIGFAYKAGAEHRKIFFLLSQLEIISERFSHQVGTELVVTEGIVVNFSFA